MFVYYSSTHKLAQRWFWLVTKKTWILISRHTIFMIYMGSVFQFSRHLVRIAFGLQIRGHFFNYIDPIMQRNASFHFCAYVSMIRQDATTLTKKNSLAFSIKTSPLPKWVNTEAETIWPAFHRQHFQMRFLEMKYMKLAPKGPFNIPALV